MTQKPGALEELLARYGTGPDLGPSAAEREAQERQIRAYLAREDAAPWIRDKLQDLLSRPFDQLSVVERDHLAVCLDAVRKHEAEAVADGVASGQVRHFTPRDPGNEGEDK